MRSSLLLAPLLLSLAEELPAQSFTHWLDPGARVRVTTPRLIPRQVVGEVTSLLPDTLVLTRGDDERVAIPNLSIDLLEVSRGEDRSRGVRQGFFLGGLVGAGLGGILGALGAKELPMGIEASAAIGFLGGGLVGGGVGAGVGALFPPESWQAYRIEHPAPTRR